MVLSAATCFVEFFQDQDPNDPLGVLVDPKNGIAKFFLGSQYSISVG